jgi:hypothetical protein
VERAIFTALTIGGDADHIGAGFGVRGLAWRVQRLQVAEFYGWSLAEIDALSHADLDDALAYASAVRKRST